MSSFAANPKYIDIWPRVKSGCSFAIDLPHAERCLNDSRIYATLAHYAGLVDDRVTLEVIKLREVPLVLYHVEGDSLWIFAGLLLRVCQLFYLQFTPQDQMAMYPYVVKIPVGDGKVEVMRSIKRGYEKRVKLYSDSLAVITAVEDELWAKIKIAIERDADNLKRHTMVFMMREALEVIVELNNVELAAFLDHDDVKAALS